MSAMSTMYGSSTLNHGKGRVLLPASWAGKYVSVALDKDRDGIKITNIATKVGNDSLLRFQPSGSENMSLLR